jgi:hypothetical protein
MQENSCLHWQLSFVIVAILACVARCPTRCPYSCVSCGIRMDGMWIWGIPLIAGSDPKRQTADNAGVSLGTDGKDITGQVWKLAQIVKFCEQWVTDVAHRASVFKTNRYMK